MGITHGIEGVKPPRTPEDGPRLPVDSIPALVHTARSDGHLDYVNKPWQKRSEGEERETIEAALAETA